MIMPYLRIIFLILLAFCLVPCPSYARDSIFEKGEINSIKNAQEISDPYFVKMIYGFINDPGEADFYTFKFSKDVTLPVEVFVPNKKGSENFKPSLAIIGPNFIRAGKPLPFLIPEDSGVVMINNLYDTSAKIFNDRATLTSYVPIARSEVDFSKDQLYYFAVFSESSATGMYALKIGQEELWGAREILNAGKAIAKIKLGSNYFAKSIGVFAGVFIIAVIIAKSRRLSIREDKIEDEI